MERKEVQNSLGIDSRERDRGYAEIHERKLGGPVRVRPKRDPAAFLFRET